MPNTPHCITWEDVRSAVTDEAIKTADEVGDPEIDSFLSGLLSSFALAAIRSKETAGNGERFQSSNGRFNFEELPRDQLLSQLQAYSGLPLVTCSAMLDVIDALSEKVFRVTDRYVLERLGEWRRSRAGYTLFLDAQLRH